MIDRILNNRYRLIEKAGSGGMADVYKGVDITDGSIVAVKVLKHEHSGDPQYLRRLEKEAQALVLLKNEHIVTLYGMGSDGDTHYLVLEYVNGMTLREYMDKTGAMKPYKAVSIICDVLDGLSHAHKAGLVHRDVKPQNIMITEDGDIKLTDFGIAKATGNATQTYDGKEAIGSVYYMSPEQAKGERIDAQTDLYSVGIMLYEMLTGKPPFSGENAVQVALKHVNDELRPLNKVTSRVSVALSDVVAKATVKDRSLRYSDADVMKQDLKRALRYPLSRFAKLPEKKETVLEDGTVQPPKKSFLKEHFPLIAIVGSVLGVIAVFLTMFLISMSNDTGELSKVPNLLGKTLSNAEIYAQNRGFGIEIAGYEASDSYSEGEICAQEPAAQTKAKDGTVIRVTLSTGTETASVPNLFSMTVDEARKALEDNGLVLDSVIEYQLSSEPAGTVIAQSPEPFKEISTGESVKITVSMENGSVTEKMPELIGKDIETAAELLISAGIEKYRITVVDDAEGYKSNTVIEQNPRGGTDVILDTVSVELTMFRSSLGEYRAEFSPTIVLTAENNEVVITLVSELGEIVMFQDSFKSGSYFVPFTGYYWKSGEYNCNIYINGEFDKMIKVTFN